MPPIKEDMENAYKTNLPSPEGESDAEKKPQSDIERLEGLIERTKKMEPKTGREKGMQEGLLEFFQHDLERAKEREIEKNMPPTPINLSNLIEFLGGLQQLPEAPKKAPRRLRNSLILVGMTSIAMTLLIVNREQILKRIYDGSAPITSKEN